jgi:prolyl oligopeptidase
MTGIIRLLSILTLLVPCALLADGLEPPATPKKPVVDEYHGKAVTDNYRWLDDAMDPAVQRWTEAQNNYTRAELEKFSALKALGKRLQELIAAPSADYSDLKFRGNILFAMAFQPPKNQPYLVTIKSPDQPDSARIIVDPNVINPKGTTAIDFYVPSRDGRLVAVSMSEGGTEEGTGYVYEVATGKQLTDKIPRLEVMGGGSLAWNADATGFWYTRSPQPGERPKEDMNFYQQIYFHKLGTPAAMDTYVLGKDFPKIAEITLDSSDDGRFVLATIQNGDGGEFMHYLSKAGGDWKKLDDFKSRASTAAFDPNGLLYMHTNDEAPHGKIVRIAADASATTVVPESESAIDAVVYHGGGFFPTFVPTANRLYVLDIVGGPSQIRVFDHQGNQLAKVPLPPLTSVSQLVPIGGDAILFRAASFVEPGAWYRYDPATNKTSRTRLFSTSPAKFDDCVVEQKFATSKDGTKVPIHILRLKTSTLDGKTPTLLYGYGGYGISMKPSFNASLRVWLDQGGIYALANIRGGSEYGEEWRRAAQLTKRQNGYDDCAACARYLIANKYTNPKKLAIRGGSNGGLLMGVQLTQHPELYRAVVSHVGIYDMLRSELHPNGAFNVMEFGTVKDSEQFKALYAYSPYHNVKDGTAYPAVFLLTGANDSRVDPANSRKMAARLQAATSSKLPVLLQVGSSGHGLDSSLSDRVAEQADVYGFLFQELGVEYKTD